MPSGSAGADAWATRAVSSGCRKTTRRLLGKSIPPHWFRDIAATTVALLDPHEVGIIGTVLGHTTRTTSERHYNHADQVLAARKYHAHLDHLRADGPADRTWSETPA
jgi:hypothetical protein